LSKSETSNQQATENQRCRASDLNPAVATITLWNTMYLERTIATLGQQYDIDDSLIS
jgi:TnpA family transposase